MKGRPRRSFVIAGRTVLITGAAAGIGRATALAFARERARLELVDLDGAALAHVAEQCRVAGALATTASETDVADAAAVNALAERVHGRARAVDVLINNAGVGLAGGLLDGSLADLRWVLDVNLWGTVHCVRAFAPAMIAARTGRIVNVASAAGWVNSDAHAAYGMSKFGVVALSEALRMELEPSGIGVSVVCPGFVDTDLPMRMRMRGHRYPERERAAVRDFYRRHGIAPERVASAILHATRTGPAVLPVSAVAYGLYYLKRFFPWVVPIVMRAAMRARPTDP